MLGFYDKFTYDYIYRSCIEMIKKQWAEKFVKQAAGVLKSNIYITNRSGQVISASNQQSLGEIYPTAVLSIQRNLPIEVEEDNLKFWNMTFPAVITPIKYKNESYGAIIVSGHPNDIRTHTRLIKINAEYVIAQDIERENDFNQVLSRTQMLSHILFSDHPDIQKYNRNHFKAQLDLDDSFVVATVYINTSSKSKLKKVRDTLENWRLPHDDIIKVSPQEYLLIFKSNQHRGETEREIKTFIEKSSDENIQEHSLITIGTFESGIRGLVQSHSNCKHLKLLLDEMNITIGVFCYLDYELEVICHTIQDTPFLNQYSLISNYERIIHFGEDNYLGETLEAYFNNHGKLLKTANDLFIHRNTLNYRLKKIHEITKWDPHTVDGIVLLRLAQILYQHQH